MDLVHTTVWQQIEEFHYGIPLVDEASPLISISHIHKIITNLKKWNCVRLVAISGKRWDSTALVHNWKWNDSNSCNKSSSSKITFLCLYVQDYIIFTSSGQHATNQTGLWIPSLIGIWQTVHLHCKVKVGKGWACNLKWCLGNNLWRLFLSIFIVI